MPPRPPDPRRTSGRRQGGGQGEGASAGAPAGASAAAPRGGLADARRYSPRGRTVREHADSADPFRPALRVLQGGAEPAAARRGARKTAETGRATPGGGGRAGSASRAGSARRPVPRRPVRPKRPPRLGEPQRRLRFGTVLALALFTLIALRLVELQLTDAKTYAAQGLSDRLHEVPLPAPRGAIYDRTGAALVHSVEARYVYGDPGQVEDPQRAAEALSPLLGVPVSELVAKLRPHKREDGTEVRFEYLARGVDIATGDRITAMNLAGVRVRRDERRDVPGHDLAANLVGFPNRELTGLAGLEAAYDDVLRGVDGMRVFETGDGKLAQEIPGGYRQETPARPGTSLQLTVDRDLQYEIQNILANRMRDRKAYFGAAVVLDVRTGEVLAQASYPSYDAADPFNAPTSARIDAATQIVVDPGSVAKVITLSAALQEGVVRPDSTVPVSPRIRKGDTEFEDDHPFPAGTRITLPAILAYSSNVGTITIAQELGAQRLYEYQRGFGLGKPTGEGLPGEASGLVQPPDRWSGSSYGSIPVGHGIAVTPLQMAAIYATIANNGVWVQPPLLKAKIAADGATAPCPPAGTRRVLSAENATALRGMLEAVVTLDGATGRSAAISGYRVAGKIASFVGMAPAEAPRYVIAVFAHTPAGTGGAVAGPAFRDMMGFTLGYYQVPPSTTPAPTFTVSG